VTSNKRRLLLFAAVGTLAGAAGALFALHRYRDQRGKIANAMMAMRVHDLRGQTRSLDQWRGRVLVVNLWATWCAPCREEIPVLVKLQDRHGPGGLQIVGVAIDRRDKVRAFAREFGINYPILLGGLEWVELSRQLGNRVGGLPFTLVFSRSATVVDTFLGQLNERKLEGTIKPLL